LDHFGLNYQQKSLVGATRWSDLCRSIQSSEGREQTQGSNGRGRRNSDPEGLAQRFEATVKTTLTHTDMRIIAQEFFDGELDIVNRIRREVMSALPRNEKQHKDIPALLTARGCRQICTQ
jgi:hypothetical protein